MSGVAQFLAKTFKHQQRNEGEIRVKLAYEE
jgi:hypothetical protein